MTKTACRICLPFSLAVLLWTPVLFLSGAHATASENGTGPPYTALKRSSDARGLIDKALALWETSKRKEGLQSADLEAEQLLKRVVTDYPGTEECAEALRHLAFGYRWKGMKAESDTAYEALFKDYPTSVQRAQAWLDLKGFSIQEGNLDKAWECYNNVVANFPGTEYSQEAMSRPPPPPCEYPTTVSVSFSPESTCGTVTYVDGTVTVRASADDLDGLSKIEIYIDAVLKWTCNVSGTSATCDYPWDTSTYSEGQHSIYAKAYDRCNDSGTSPTYYRTVDRTAPTCNITYPPNGSTVHGTSVTITATAADNFYVKEVRFYRDEAVHLGTDTTSPYTVSWDSTTVADGVHALYAVAYDCVGSAGLSPSIDVTVNNTGCSAEAYYFALGAKAASNLTGAQARIECRNVVLCNELAQAPDTHSAASAGVLAGSDYGVSMGWLKQNYDFQSPPYVRRAVFYEMYAPNNEYWINYGGDPGNNQMYTYKAVASNTLDGTWVFYLNGEYFDQHNLNGWRNRKGTQVNWQGEIFRKETDMPGTSGDPCTFENCMYKADATWYDAGLAAGDMFSSDQNNWAYEYLTGTSFNIWDKSPK